MTLEAMKDALAGLADRRPAASSFGSGGVSGALAANMMWLLCTASGYTRRLLSQADVAAVFLSRRILLDRTSLQGV